MKIVLDDRGSSLICSRDPAANLNGFRALLFHVEPSASTFHMERFVFRARIVESEFSWIGITLLDFGFFEIDCTPKNPGRCASFEPTKFNACSLKVSR